MCQVLIFVFFYTKVYSENNHSYFWLLHATNNLSILLGNEACILGVAGGVKSRKSTMPSQRMRVYFEMRVQQAFSILSLALIDIKTTREGFLRKNIVAVSFFQNCAIHQYS